MEREVEKEVEREVEKEVEREVEREGQSLVVTRKMGLLGPLLAPEDSDTQIAWTLQRFHLESATHIKGSDGIWNKRCRDANLVDRNASLLQKKKKKKRGGGGRPHR